jgi:hypothetical protein
MVLTDAPQGPTLTSPCKENEGRLYLILIPGLPGNLALHIQDHRAS